MKHMGLAERRAGTPARQQGGFTLLELIIVLVSVGILLALVLIYRS